MPSTARSTRFVLIAGLIWPALAGAVGLGEITVRSHLNQPLDAEIALVSGDLASGAEGPIDLDRIRVSLASIGEHCAADIEFLDVMRSIRLRLHHGGDGPVIRVTSKDAIREPVLSFLVELASRQGRMLREYVVLLDPPGYRILPRRTPRRSTRRLRRLGRLGRWRRR